MPYPELKGLLTDIGVEELGHLEMIGTMVHQLTRNLTEDEIEKNPNFMAYFVDHTAGVYPTAASGSPWNAASIASTGDTIGDLNENLAAEQKARVTYDNILRLVDDPDIIEPIKFLREREIVHYQRFGEGLRLVTDKLDVKTTMRSILLLINDKKQKGNEFYSLPFFVDIFVNIIHLIFPVL